MMIKLIFPSMNLKVIYYNKIKIIKFFDEYELNFN
jgi:hypothetical protein